MADPEPYIPVTYQTHATCTTRSYGQDNRFRERRHETHTRRTLLREKLDQVAYIFNRYPY
jgi:hypothetical protein